MKSFRNYKKCNLQYKAKILLSIYNYFLKSYIFAFLICKTLKWKYSKKLQKLYKRKFKII